jgi:alginate O-acetyltransferase complex protein AlgI
MVFCSQIFIFLFLPICLIFYYALPAVCRNAVLLVFSILFYAWGETQYLWLIFSSVLINYILGIGIEKSRQPKLILVAGVCINLLSLVYFKYLGFFADIFQVHLTDKMRNMVLPLGISFYTFHSISYLVDIYRKKVTAQRNIFKMGLYIINFSQLVAGPIIRYHDVAGQLNHRNHTLNRFGNGFSSFIIGLAKKVLIANILGEMADTLFASNPTTVSPLQAWTGVLAYSLQIYFDFSGYSDMAIGLGRMFGFEFRANFNFPYISRSIKEFWRRWHISLSNWFRDYVYVPLGGNKKSKSRTALNLFLIFILCGLWHGANVTFLIWGLYHGAFLALERGGWGNRLKKLPSVVRNLYMWLVVSIGWVFFRSDNMEDATGIIKKIFFIDTPRIASVDISSYINPYFTLILITALLFALKLPYRLYMHLIREKSGWSGGLRSAGYAALLILFLVCLADIVSSTYNPFIYYRF